MKIAIQGLNMTGVPRSWARIAFRLTLTATALTLAALLLSLFIRVGIELRGGPRLTLWGDAMILSYRSSNGWSDLATLPNAVRVEFDPSIEKGHAVALQLPGKGSVPFCSTGRVAVLPMWIPLAALVFASYALSRLCRKRATCECLQCGYDLTANVSGTCPECGTRIEVCDSGDRVTHRHHCDC